MEEENDYRQYVIFRGDMKSLTPLKACAQAVHASDLLNLHMKDYPTGLLTKYYYENSSELGFQTTICMEAPNWEMISNFMFRLNSIEEHLISLTVHDPTYPVPDGGITHLIPLHTCLIVYGQESVIRPITEEFGFSMKWGGTRDWD